MANSGGDRTSIQELKVQIRRKDGKIFGPYTRREVLGFIYSKRLDGSENILIEGTDRWRPINSDTEFFDALQEILFGIKPDASKKSKSSAKNHQETVVGIESDDEIDGATSVSAGAAPSDGDAGLTKVSAKKSSKKPSQEKQKPQTDKPVKANAKEPNHAGHVENVPVADKHDAIEEGQLVTPHTAKAPPAKPAKKMTLPLILVLVLLAAILVAQKQKNESTSLAPLDSKQTLDATPAYFRPLMLRFLALSPIEVPSVPDNLQPVQEYSLPQGFGAHVFTDEIKHFFSVPPTQRTSAEGWMRFVWSLKWLGEIMSTYSAPIGQDLLKKASTTYESLSKKTKLPPEFDALYGQIENIADGNFVEVQKNLANNTDELSRWILSEVAWLRYWKGDFSGEEWLKQFSDEKFSSTNLEAAHQVKKLFLQKSPDTVFWLDQLAVEDPESYSLWFVSAEYFWRVQSAFLQKSYLFWVSGLGAISLYPKSYQTVYLSQMSTLIKLFGRQDPAAQIASNIDVVEKGDVATKLDRWNPIFGPSIDVDQLTDEILDSGSSQRLAPIRLASLQNLSFTVSRRGGRKLLQVGYYWIFEKNYQRALETFDSATNFEDAKPEAWGSKVWLYSERFQFDKALDALAHINSLPQKGNLNDLYEAILHYFARDYDFAKPKFEQFLKASPGSGLGHYFYARLLETMGKNVDCAQAAFLGGSNGVGEIGFRSRLLFYRCRILAGLQVSAALADLEKMYQADPGNTAAVVEYIQGLSNAQLTDRAILTGREAVEKFPRSYELRLALGDAYLKNREYDKALAFYNNARRFRPESPEAFLKIGDLLQSQDRNEEAAENYQVAAQLNPEYPEIWLKAAKAFRKAGKKDEALNAYNKELDARPSVLQTFLDVAEYLLEQSSPQAVLDLFQKYQASFNDDPRVSLRLAQAYLGLQNYEKARDRAAFAQNRLPTYPEPYRILGIISDIEGNYPSAKRYLNQYLKLLPQAEDADVIRKKLSQPPYSEN